VESASKGLPAREPQRSLSKAEILRGHEAFREVLTKGRRLQGNHILSYLQRINSQHNRAVPVQVGFAVGRGVKSAAKRNHVRRLMREAYRLNKSILIKVAREKQKFLNIVFLYMESKNVNTSRLKLKDIESDIRRTLVTVLTLE
jgi:ribonuclease P protein component